MNASKSTAQPAPTAWLADDFGPTHPAHQVVDFWQAAGASRWFAKDPVFDSDFQQRFQHLHFAAARQECSHWLADPKAGLALILLLDQFPRNVFRGTAHMFATDPLARQYAHVFLDAGLIDQLDIELQTFACVPFMHSESLDDQEYSLVLYKRYAPGSMRWADDHHDIIRRFGRFPHRNASMARITTAQEQAFLDAGGFAG
ncbi:MAG: DUF924 family protein [Burkholderiaceae bacterium]|nr:DUF924 family protein [Burkholderiaceae bacterium]